jgi:membrane-associated phospholipid phosphatase
MANEALRARMIAGLNYRSDLQRARALGHKVAQLAIARAATDGATNTGFSEGPFTGDQFWTPTPAAYESPLGGPVGTWKPWVVPNYHQFVDVIPPPSPYGSPAFLQQVNDVLDVSAHLTDEQRQIAQFWDDEPGTFTPPGHWMSIALTYIKSYKVSDRQAARVLAYLGASQEDSVITWFGLKYHYWQVRPITAIWRLSADRTHVLSEAQVAADPSLAPLRNVWTPFIPTPSFPSYPAGHPTFSGDAAKLLTYFFPRAGDTLNRLARQVADARVYGGIHYPEDVDEALVLGHAIADKFIARAATDGSAG